MKYIQKAISWISGLHKTQKIIVILFVICIGVVIFTGFASRRNDSFDVFTVTRGDISETITNSGNVTTNSNTAVYSPSSGIVEAVYVNNGDPVSQGQTLVKVKSTATDIDRANALAAYHAAQSALNTSKQTKITNQSLLEAGRKTVIDASVALEQLNVRLSKSANNPATGEQYKPDEIESIKSAYTSAKQSFESLERKFTDSDSSIGAAQSAVAAKWLMYEATLNGDIRAPISGTVMNISVGPGDAVRADSSQDLSGVPLLRISTLENLTIKVSLSEIDIAKVSRNQKTTVVFDAIPDKTFPATVSRVDTVGTNANAVVTYDAYVALVDSDERIRPGMSATVTIQTDPKIGVLLVPNIGLTKENNQIIVRAQEGKSVVSKTVRIGIKNSLQSEALSGVSEGDKLIIPKSK